MGINNYSLNEDSKDRYALDSMVFSYINKSGNKDNLKIEINYMNRTHIYEPEIRDASISFLCSLKILTLNKYELFGSKIKALLERCTIRDVYDVYHMLNSNLFNYQEYSLIKKCFIFYMAIGKTTERKFDEVINDFFHKIETYMTDKIPQYLSSTLRKDDTFDMKVATNEVKDFINNLIVLNENETRFLKEFDKGNYNPTLLFDNHDIISRIINHPMAKWKISNK